MKKTFFLISLWLILTSCTTSNTTYTSLTACLDKNQVVMFGASWCPHCAEQKKLFWKSVKNLPYFECANGNQQVQECTDRGIASYPTWQFQDAIIKALPKEAITNLYTTELQKVRSTQELYANAVKGKDAEAEKFVATYGVKLDQLVKSSVSEYEKLSKMTVLSDGPDGKIIERPAYLAGRVAGQRPLSEIALYAGCSVEYQADISRVGE